MRYIRTNKRQIGGHIRDRSGIYGGPVTYIQGTAEGQICEIYRTNKGQAMIEDR